jgi:hypothetical protein
MSMPVGLKTRPVINGESLNIHWGEVREKHHPQ